MRISEAVDPTGAEPADPTTAAVVIQVLGDDELRCEDVLRSFHQDLSSVDQVTVRLEYANGTEPAAGAKGPLAETLHAVIEYAWPAAAPLLAERIKALCSRQRHERVRVSVGPDFVEIKGDPSEEQARLLAEMLRGLQK
jgi:hypothetical protein